MFQGKSFDDILDLVEQVLEDGVVYQTNKSDISTMPPPLSVVSVINGKEYVLLMCSQSYKKGFVKMITFYQNTSRTSVLVVKGWKKY